MKYRKSHICTFSAIWCNLGHSAVFPLHLYERQVTCSTPPMVPHAQALWDPSEGNVSTGKVDVLWDMMRPRSCREYTFLHSWCRAINLLNQRVISSPLPLLSLFHLYCKVLWLIKQPCRNAYASGCVTGVTLCFCLLWSFLNQKPFHISLWNLRHSGSLSVRWDVQWHAHCKLWRRWYVHGLRPLPPWVWATSKGRPCCTEVRKQQR